MFRKATRPDVSNERLLVAAAKQRVRFEGMRGQATFNHVQLAARIRWLNFVRFSGNGGSNNCSGGGGEAFR